MYFLTVLETRSLSSRCQLSWFLWSSFSLACRWPVSPNTSTWPFLLCTLLMFLFLFMRTPVLLDENLTLTISLNFACMLSCFSCVRLFATLWTVAHQAPCVDGVLQARVLEWVPRSFSRGSSLPRDWTYVPNLSCIDRRILYHLAPPGKPI